MTSKVLEIKKSSSSYHIFSHAIVTNLFVFKLLIRYFFYTVDYMITLYSHIILT